MLVVKKDYETIKNKAYTVLNKENNKKYSVLFKGNKNMWVCDCTWYSLKQTYCKHIKAVLKKINSKKVESLVKDLGV